MFSPSTQPSWDRCKPASIIIPNVLYLSSLSEAINPKICGSNGYLKPTHIINLSNKENSNVFENIGVKYLTIRIDDSESSNISQYFEETFNFIDECRRKNGKCLLHCQMGISRASTICIYYLMCAKNMTLQDAYRYLKFRRPEIFPNRNFMIQLMEAEIRLRKGESSVKYTDIGKIGGLLSEYNNATPAGKESNMMCDTCFVM
jgi:protein-tyrosine phosphatase